MENDIFDTRALDIYDRELLKLASEQLPKETKAFLRKEGTALKKQTVNTAKSKVKKKTGNYLKGIKRGKVYKYNKGGTAIRVYGGKPAYHANLLEYGHVLKGHEPDKKIIKNIKGYFVFDKARRQFANKFNNDVVKFVNEVVVKKL